MSRGRDALGLAVSIGGCLLAGVLGSLLTRPAIDPWYRGLTKPPLTPPDAAFGVVWPILYVLMGLAAWLVWRRGPGDAAVRAALGMFAAQLALNVAWSGVFFGLRAPVGGLAVVAALWALILLTTLRFRPVSAAAAALMQPYLLWVTFAAYLNAGIVLLNA